MAETLINLMVQLLAGVIGGNAAGAAFKDYDLGMLGNTITGAIGGGVIGQALQALLPSLAGGSGGLDIGALLGQIVGGGAGGVILTVIAGFVKSAMAGPQVR
jgi:hypothetical protein